MVVPYSEHQDSIGPMTRSVKDAAYVLETIAGEDPADNYTSAIPSNQTREYVSACRLGGLQGKRIGIPRNLIQLAGEPSGDQVIAAFEKAIAIVESAGAVVVDNTNITTYEEYISDDRMSSYAVLCADFVSGISSYLSNLVYNPHNLRNQADIRSFTWNFPPEDYPEKDTSSWDLCLASGLNNTQPDFWSYFSRNQALLGGKQGLPGTMEAHNLDAFMIPTIWAAEVPAIVGSPVISVPMGVYAADTPVSYSPFGDGDLVYSAPGIP